MLIQTRFNYDVVNLDNHIDLWLRICAHCKVNSVPFAMSGYEEIEDSFFFFFFLS